MTTPAIETAGLRKTYGESVALVSLSLLLGPGAAVLAERVAARRFDGVVLDCVPERYGCEAVCEASAY